MKEMMHVDMMGGAGVESHENKARLEHDNRHAASATGEAAPGATFPETGNPARSEEPAEGVEERQEEPATMNHDQHQSH
jgi:cytochrome o ubiquinol oxidase subunit II